MTSTGTTPSRLNNTSSIQLPTHSLPTLSQHTFSTHFLFRHFLNMISLPTLSLRNFQHSLSGPQKENHEDKVHPPYHIGMLCVDVVAVIIAVTLSQHAFSSNTFSTELPTLSLWSPEGKPQGQSIPPISHWNAVC